MICQMPVAGFRTGVAKQWLVNHSLAVATSDFWSIFKALHGASFPRLPFPILSWYVPPYDPLVLLHHHH